MIGGKQAGKLRRRVRPGLGLAHGLFSTLTWGQQFTSATTLRTIVGSASPAGGARLAGARSYPRRGLGPGVIRAHAAPGARGATRSILGDRLSPSGQGAARLSFLCRTPARPVSRPRKHERSVLPWPWTAIPPSTVAAAFNQSEHDQVRYTPNSAKGHFLS